MTSQPMFQFEIRLKFSASFCRQVAEGLLNNIFKYNSFLPYNESLVRLFPRYFIFLVSPVFNLIDYYSLCTKTTIVTTKILW